VAIYQIGKQFVLNYSAVSHAVKSIKAKLQKKSGDAGSIQ
jgi:hypothetical protein